MTPEGKVKEQLKRILKEAEVYWHMPVQNGMGAPTLDFICCYRGFYLAIETKAPGQKLTARQEITMGAIRKAGGVAMTFDGSDQSCEALYNWIEFVRKLDIH